MTRSTSGLLRDLAVFYARGGGDQEVVEREVLDKLPWWRSAILAALLPVLARLVRDAPTHGVDEAASELARRIVDRRAQRRTP